MKRLLYFVPTHILVFYSFGILFQHYAFFSISFTFLFVICGLLLLLSRFLKVYLLGFYSSVFLLGALSVKTHKTPKNDYKNSIKASNVVVFSITDVLKSNIYNYRYYADILEVDGHKSKGSVLVSVEKKGNIKSFQIGDNILAQTYFEPIKKPLNPYGFSYKDYLQKNNISHQLFLKKGMWAVLSKNKFSLKRIASILREKLIYSLDKNLSNKDVLSITEAMLLGQRQNISKKLQQDYANAGAIHILAVSGLHVGILVLFLNFLLKPIELFRNGKKWKLFFLILLLWCFAFLAGLSPSVIRAVTMFSFISVGIILGSNITVFYSLITSALFLLCINPFYLFDVGFQMSYLAVFSIITIVPLFQELWNPKHKLINYFWKLISVSISAQMGVLPISLFYFHQFPGLFILTNLVVIPCVGFILVFGIVLLLLAILEMLPFFISESYSFIVFCLNTFINWVSEQEKFILKEIHFSELEMVCSYILISIFLFSFKTKTIKSVFILLSAIILFQGVFIYEKLHLKNRNELIIFNQYKETNLMFTVNGEAKFYTSNKEKSQNIMKDYVISTGVHIYEVTDSIYNLYNFKDNTIFVIDSTGLYSIKKFKSNIVLLINSPKINLERMLNHLQPKIVIADGSNKKQNTILWKKTCEENNVKFYNTFEKGALVLKI